MARPPGRRPSRATASASLSASSMSAVSGAIPASPRITARSVMCPLPVSASEPCSSTSIRVARPSSLSPSSTRKRRAATIGPMVCELDGPMPTLKMSRTLCMSPALYAP